MPTQYAGDRNQKKPVIGTGASRTPKEVMGSQGSSVSGTVHQNAWHFKNRPTGNKSFPGGTKSSNAAKSKQRE